MIVGDISEKARTVAEARYLSKVKGEKTLEDVFKRVSMGNLDYMLMMKNLIFLPNSPTLFNLGLDNGCTLSACFVFDIADTLRDGPKSIMQVVDKAAAVAKAGGGVGYYFGNLRGKGALVRGMERSACGPVKVLRFLHGLRNMIKQGSKRDLAQMGVLDAHHPDIEEWINAKVEDPKALESFNISVSWRNEMLDEVFNSYDSGPKHLWDLQCQAAWACGCPGMLFYDTINKANATPHLGDINATNPCGETPNLDDEPCNLGSLAICRFVKQGIPGRPVTGYWDIDWTALEEFVRLAIRFLDDILDANEFPHPDIKRAAFLTRKLGLGVMGLADLFAILGIPYDSEDAVALSSELARKINQWALVESMKLAVDKGPYSAWETGGRTMWPKARNSTRTSIAPTGTIALLADVSHSIEPYYTMQGQRVMNEGIKLPEGIPTWVQKLLSNGHDPKTAHEINWMWHIKHQAAWQKHTDLGVSKTINMPKSATIEDISNAYHMMWKLGCKGGTIYRDNCRPEQVLTKSKSVYETDPGARSISKLKELPKFAIPADQFTDLKRDTLVILPNGPREKITMPDDIPQLPRHRFYAGNTKCYLHVGTTPDGKAPVEFFLKVSKSGSTLQCMIDTWAMACSNALQYQMPLESLVRLHEGTRFEPSGPTRNKDLPICTSIPDYVVRFLQLKFLGKSETINGTGQYCPECSTELYYSAGCLTCPKCHWSRCG